MPKYKVDISTILFEEDVRKIYNEAKNAEERVFVSLLWTTGARTKEILLLTKEDIQYSPDRVNILLKTLKLGQRKTFMVKERTLEFERPQGVNCNIYLETIINYVKTLSPEARLLERSNRWAQYITNKLGVKAMGKPISPYHFRHSCMTWLLRNGATPDMAMHFKGSASIKSIEPYIHAVPFVVKEQNRRRAQLKELNE
jgi:integrase